MHGRDVILKGKRYLVLQLRDKSSEIAGQSPADDAEMVVVGTDIRSHCVVHR